MVHHRVLQSLLEHGTWHFLGPLLLQPNTMGWSLATSSPVSLPVTKTAFPCSTQQQAPSHWEDLYQPPPTTAPSLPVTVREVGRPHTWLLQHQMMVSIMCFSTLLSSNVVSAAAGWDWSESLSGMGSKCNFLIVWTIVMIHICTICRVLLQPIN